MTVRQINFALWTLCASLAIGSVIVIVAAARAPLAMRKADSDLPSPRLSKAVTSAAPMPSDEQFRSLFSKTFRPSFDAAPNATVDVPALAPDLASPSQVKLIGTIGSGLAILKGPDGTEALAEIGEDVNGAILIAIRPSEIDLRTAAGQTLTLRRDPDAESPDVQIREVSPSASRQ